MSKVNYKRLGDYICKVDKRNKDLQVSKLMGLSMSKEFRETTSNIIGTDLSVYKVVEKWQFACDFMSPIRVNKLPIVLKLDDEPIIVSPAYPVFEIIDHNALHPEYLMMWFRRDEFDRFVTFKCDSAIRGGYDWAEMCNTELPVPSIEKQREIVAEYNAVQKRIDLNNQLIQKLEETAQAIYKQWFVEFEFPNEEGKPYKSNGGDMVESELGEIPKGWRVGRLSDIATYLNGLAMQNYPQTSSDYLPVLKIREISKGGFDSNSDKGSKEIPKEYIVNNGDVIFSWSGTLKVDLWCGGQGALNQHLFKVTSINYPKWYYYLWTKYHLTEFIRIAEGKATSLGHIKREHLDEAKVLIPTDEQIIDMNKYFDSVISNIIQKKGKVLKLNELQSLLLSKMARVEE